MRGLVLFTCAIAAAVALVGAAAAAEPTNGQLSLEGGRGSVVLDLRGVVLGRLAAGTLRVTDMTPRDRFAPTVSGKNITVERVGPRALLYRGLALRFKMLGGRYRIAIRGSGMSVSAVGRGSVVLDAEPRFVGDDVGVFSLDGTDCVMAARLCLPLPDLPQRYELGTDAAGTGKAAR